MLVSTVMTLICDKYIFFLQNNEKAGIPFYLSQVKLKTPFFPQKNMMLV